MSHSLFRAGYGLAIFPAVFALTLCVSCDDPGEGDPTDDDDTTDEEPEDPTPDCSYEPDLPADFEILADFGSGEDFDLDANGRHGSVEAGTLLLRSMDGDLDVFLPGLGERVNGTRLLPSGDWVVADASTGDLVKLTADGNEILLSGLSYPNGVEVDADGYVYVSENSAGRVQRVHAETGDVAVVAEDLGQPNGIIESPDGQTLYVGTCSLTGWGSRGLIYAIGRTGADSWDEPEIVFESEGEGCVDALNVDACGRVYFADYTDGLSECLLWHLDLVTGETELAAEISGHWISNMRWGHGVGGWDDQTLYACDRMEQSLYAVHLGVPGNPHVLD